MLNWIDDLLNDITMYRLVLYVLLGLLAAAMIFGALHMLPYSPLAILFSTLILLAACWAVNTLFGYVFKVPTNSESFFITALILALIVAPPKGSFGDVVPFLFWVSTLAMASKFILAAWKKHIFNPAAFAVVVTSFVLGQGANWWVGTAVMLPWVLIGGLLITRKIQRFDLVISFMAAALVMIILTSASRSAPGTVLEKTFNDSPILFFAFVMLTEPLTTPPTRLRRILYGIFTGLLFAPVVHIGPIYSTPELALLAGNVFSYFLSPKKKYLLTLKQKTQEATGMYNFVFEGDGKMSFRPGQYMEWTLGHERTDARGNRRYFTVASSPTEKDIHLGVKFYENPSTFKQALLALPEGGRVLAGQLAGDFTLPKDASQRLVFIAGGIGITPFRSMLKYIIDKQEKRSITLLYSSRHASEIMYLDIFKQAANLGIKSVFTLTDEVPLPAGWEGYQGYINSEMIIKEVPDYKERTFYISGPHNMVVAFEKTLKSMGVPRAQIKVDFFPGLA